MRVLSGIQPSGSLHLGNYFGMMKRMIAYQATGELYCFIVNYHALTTQTDGAKLASQTLEAAADFLSLGLDPEKSIFWVQSDLPEVAELTWILSNLTPLGLLERCHSFKDKVAQGIKPHHGLFSYPILMAADILIMQAERVPVGQDQKQHVEVARDLAIKFNHLYGEFFKLPEPDIEKDTGVIPGLDGRKMSKSYNNTIEIFCSKDTLEAKIKSLKTDSTPIDEPKKLEANNLFRLFSLFVSAKEHAELENRFLKPGLKYSEIKKELVETIWNYFAPYREKRKQWTEDPARLKRTLAMGAEKARQKANVVMTEVRKRVGLTWGG